MNLEHTVAGLSATLQTLAGSLEQTKQDASSKFTQIDNKLQEHETTATTQTKLLETILAKVSGNQ